MTTHVHFSLVSVLTTYENFLIGSWCLLYFTWFNICYVILPSEALSQTVFEVVDIFPVYWGTIRAEENSSFRVDPTHVHVLDFPSVSMWRVARNSPARIITGFSLFLYYVRQITYVEKKTTHLTSISWLNK